MESKLQISDKGDLLDFSLDGGIATQGDQTCTRRFDSPLSPYTLFGVLLAEARTWLFVCFVICVCLVTVDWPIFHGFNKIKILARIWPRRWTCTQHLAPPGGGDCIGHLSSWEKVWFHEYVWSNPRHQPRWSALGQAPILFDLTELNVTFRSETVTWHVLDLPTCVYYLPRCNRRVTCNRCCTISIRGRGLQQQSQSSRGSGGTYTVSVHRHGEERA